MHGVHYGLMGLSFALGLLLTFAFSIRRVTVPAQPDSTRPDG
ncbi:channel accessory protein ArfC [Mycolicibacter terrae]|nr:hypothetical protein [Mycolicibacter terrae]